MAFYLGIYRKHGEIISNEVAPVILDFKQQPERNALEVNFPGFQFYYATRFAKSVFIGNKGMCSIAGHMIWTDHHPNKNANQPAQVYHLIEDVGASILPQTEGCFALINYQQESHQLVLANDKFGIMPLFIFENDDYIIFSNEYESLAKFPGATQLNNEAIAEFFTLGISLGNKTFFSKINHLQPASYLSARKVEIIRSIYWTPSIELDSRDINILASETFQLFEKVNQETLDAEITKVCLLSAGADSRLILASMTQAQREKSIFYTSNLSFLAEDEDKDVVGAKMLAEEFHLQQRIEKVSFYEHPFGANYFLEYRKLREQQVYGGWDGGEFLGGFCFKAAPIGEKISFNQVDELFKSIFNRRFRRTLTEHPYNAYERIKEPTLLFYIKQFTQSFFTSIYGGARGHWLQPYQLANHGYSPFWDSRIIQKLLSIPVQMLADYHFYNLVFSNADPRFLRIPSNSPLTNREDSVIPKLNIGKEPKHQLPDVHHRVFAECLVNEKTWRKKLYRKRRLEKILIDESNAVSKRWLDFEVWYTHYMNL